MFLGSECRDEPEGESPPLQKTVAPYGSWDSPITSDVIVGTTISLKGVFLSDFGEFWLEGRPQEGAVHRFID